MSKLTLGKIMTHSKSLKADARANVKSSILYDTLHKAGFREGHFRAPSKTNKVTTSAMWMSIQLDASAALNKKQKDVLFMKKKDFMTKYKLTKEEFVEQDWKGKRAEAKKIRDNNLKVWRTAMVSRSPKKKPTPKPPKQMNYRAEWDVIQDDFLGSNTDPAMPHEKLAPLFAQIRELLPATNITKSGK
tara:strand:- start:64 stop:627 length:564 start_codon:yes stop_codon:yes gene_type:complete